QCNNRSDNSSVWSAGGRGDQRLNGFAAFRPNQCLYLSKQLPSRRLLAENKTADRQGDQKQRRNGKQGIIGQRGTEMGRLVFAPACRGLFEQVEHLLKLSAHSRLILGAWMSFVAAPDGTLLSGFSSLSFSTFFVVICSSTLGTKA